MIEHQYGTRPRDRLRCHCFKGESLGCSWRKRLSPTKSKRTLPFTYPSRGSMRSGEMGSHGQLRPVASPMSQLAVMLLRISSVRSSNVIVTSLTLTAEPVPFALIAVLRFPQEFAQKLLRSLSSDLLARSCTLQMDLVPACRCRRSGQVCA